MSLSGFTGLKRGAVGVAAGQALVLRLLVRWSSAWVGKSALSVNPTKGRRRTFRCGAQRRRPYDAILPTHGKNGDSRPVGGKQHGFELFAVVRQPPRRERNWSGPATFFTYRGDAEFGANGPAI